jgi:NAD(P)H-dependent FMN reductase
MLRMVVRWSVLILIVFTSSPAWSDSVRIENASFEAPAVVPGGFPAVPMVDQWTEIDLDVEGSANTGVFANTPAGGADHVVNADGDQLAFLGSEQGNALEQTLQATYQVGHDYHLRLAVGVSGMFPPSSQGLIDTLELVLYYTEDGNSVDIIHQTVPATGLSSTLLRDASVYLPLVNRTDAWAGKTVGIAIRANGAAGGFWDLDHVRLSESVPVSIPIENASFEAPDIIPGTFPAIPIVDQWIEFDLDPEGSTNTGVFANTPADSDDHVVNAHGNQLAFLGSEQGNALEQDLEATYQIGCDYHLALAVGVSGLFPPSGQEPIDALELVLYYLEDGNSVDIVHQTVSAAGMSSTTLMDVSAYLPTVKTTDAWAGKTMGVAIRAAGAAGGFWDLDQLRLVESMPQTIPIDNASFEAPAVAPGAFPALPMVDQWFEIDLDALGSTNTGIFANSPADSDDHVVNADGHQLAFLGSDQGNALQQDLQTTFQVGHAYRLTVALGVSSTFPPSSQETVDTLDLVLYYVDDTDPVDVIHLAVPATGLSPTQLQDVSIYLPTVSQTDAWADKAMGVAIRATGTAGGFWDLDHVRLAESPVKAELTLTGQE